MHCCRSTGSGLLRELRQFTYCGRVVFTDSAEDEAIGLRCTNDHSASPATLLLAFERFALYQLHDQGAILHAVNLRDIRKIQRRQNLGFALKSRESFGILRRGDLRKQAFIFQLCTAAMDRFGLRVS